MTRTPLMTAETLRQRQQQQHITIINGTWFMPNDSRDAHLCHQECHIEDAHFFDIDAIKDMASPLPHMLPSLEDFIRMMNARGIASDHPIVVYDDVGSWSSARVWWHLRAFGHEDVSILHGGLPAWRAANLPVASGMERHSAVNSLWRDRRAKHSIDFADLRALVQEDEVMLLDARPKARFDGTEAEPRAGLASGHITHSVNVPYSSVLRDDGVFYETEAVLRQRLGDALSSDLALVTSCGSGVTACILAAACAICGKEARVYDGSWAEWGAQDELIEAAS